MKNIIIVVLAALLSIALIYNFTLQRQSLADRKLVIEYSHTIDSLTKESLKRVADEKYYSAMVESKYAEAKRESEEAEKRYQNK